jgi:hypothetical protein
VLSQVSPEAFLEIVAAGARVLLEATGFLVDSGFGGPAEIDETRRGQLLPFVLIDERLKHADVEGVTGPQQLEKDVLRRGLFPPFVVEVKRHPAAFGGAARRRSFPAENMVIRDEKTRFVDEETGPVYGRAHHHRDVVFGLRSTSAVKGGERHETEGDEVSKTSDVKAHAMDSERAGDNTDEHP